MLFCPFESRPTSPDTNPSVREVKKTNSHHWPLSWVPADLVAAGSGHAVGPSWANPGRCINSPSVEIAVAATAPEEWSLGSSVGDQIPSGRALCLSKVCGCVFLVLVLRNNRTWAHPASSESAWVYSLWSPSGLSRSWKLLPHLWPSSKVSSQTQESTKWGSLLMADLVAKFE